MKWMFTTLFFYSFTGRAAICDHLLEPIYLKGTYSTRQENVSYYQLQQMLENEETVVTLVTLLSGEPRYLVVTALDDKSITVRDPFYGRRDLRTTFDLTTFAYMWQMLEGSRISHHTVIRYHNY